VKSLLFLGCIPDTLGELAGEPMGAGITGIVEPITAVS
jgi:hypothetical protein